MAEGTQNKGSTAGGLISLVLLVSPFAFFILGFSIGLSQGSGPNPRGATAPQSISVAPESKQQQSIADLGRLSNSDDFLKKNSQSLVELQAKTLEFSTLLEANDPKMAFISEADRPRAKELLGAILADLQIIRGKVEANNAKQASADVIRLKDRLAKLAKLGSKSQLEVIALAIKLVEENIASGYTKYPYDQDTRANLALGKTPLRSDCTSFVSYLFYKNGATDLASPLNTLGFLSNASQNKLGLKLVLDGRTTPIDPEAVRKEYRPGDILIQGSMTPTRPRHALIFIGDTKNGDMAHSSRKGISYASSDKRLRAPYRTLGLIRYES